VPTPDVRRAAPGQPSPGLPGGLITVPGYPRADGPEDSYADPGAANGNEIGTPSPAAL